MINVLNSLILTHQIILNHFTHQNVYSTNTNQPIFTHCNFKWTNTNITNFLLVLFESKNSICNLSTYFSLPRHKQYPTQLLNDLNLDLEVMWKQIRVEQEYSKKYTTSENQASRYSMLQFIRIMKDYFMRILVVVWVFRDEWLRRYAFTIQLMANL